MKSNLLDPVITSFNNSKMKTGRLKKVLLVSLQSILDRKSFFPKNYLLWISLYFIVEYYKPTSNNPFSIESNHLSHNQIFLILLISHPLLVFIDTYSFAKFLKQNSLQGKMNVVLSLAVSLILYRWHLVQFEHFGDDGLMNSIFFGLSYFFVLLASIAAFNFGIRILQPAQFKK